MKSKKLTLSLNIVLVFALVLSIALPCLALHTATDTAYAATDNYYAGITATKGTALLGQLHDLIVSTHTNYTSYDDCKSSKVNQTDPGPNGVGVMEFYTQQSITKFSGTLGTWNREHVWCQSLSSGLWGTSGGGSDMHHIRPSESGINSIRGNNKYGEVGSNSNVKEAWTRNSNGNNVALGGHYVGSSIFEPLDNVKGDVARIVMYVYTHYNNASNVGGTKESATTHGNLPITNVIYASNDSAAWQMLLKWNRLDPVDDIERNRNEAVYGIQGNRNPFIDNEDYAEAIWGDGTTEKVELQSLTLTPKALSLDIGASQTLTVQGSPANANASVLWTSSDTSVATVVNGRVTAVSDGTATITVTSTQNADIKATAIVTVKNPKTATAITVSGTPSVTQYQAGQEFNPVGLTVKVTYDDGTDATFTSQNDLKQFEWLDATTGQSLLTEDTATIKCKLGNVDQTCAFTVTVTAPPEQISGFIASVSAIGSATTLQGRFDAIKASLAAYGQLTAAEKGNASAQGAYQNLLNEINDYNAEVDGYNATMSNATQAGCYAVCGVTLASIALLAVLKRKFN